MPFLKAGFNGRNHDTGIRAWTRHVLGKRFEPAELRRFEHGDYFWFGDRTKGGAFLSWGEQVVVGTWNAFELKQEWQEGLEQSLLPDRPPRMEKISLTIIGEPASKANSRELVTMNRYSPKAGHMVKMPALIKSEKARDYERDALIQIPPAARVRFDMPVRVTMHIFYASERPDLDESVVLDVLQDRYAGSGDERVLVQKGVYRNDRQVREKHIYWGKDPKNPRAEIEVEPLVGQADMLIERAA